MRQRIDQSCILTHSGNRHGGSASRLRRRGYILEPDIDFETPTQNTERYTKGYVDLLVNFGASTPMFVVEVKRNGKTLTVADAKQARTYGASLKTPFVVVTNGSIVQVFNTSTGDPLRWNGRLADKIPSRDRLPYRSSSSTNSSRVATIGFGT